MRGTAVARVALVYIGALVGAGFASGRELATFFAPFGPWGLLGAALAGLGLGGGGLALVRRARQTGASSYTSLLSLAPRPLGSLLAAALHLFLFASLAIMLSAAGSLVEDQLRLPRAWGIAILAVVALACCWGRTPGYVRTSAPLALILLGLLLLTSLASLATPAPHVSLASPGHLAMVQRWWWSAALYAGYNLLLGAAVLPTLASTGSAADKGALLGGSLVGLTAAVGTLALQRLGSTSDLPLLTAACLLGAAGRLLYSLSLALAVVTTAAANLFGLAQAGKAYRLRLVLFTAGAVPPALLPFSTLVGHLYPAFGYAGLLLLATLLAPARHT